MLRYKLQSECCSNYHPVRNKFSLLQRVERASTTCHKAAQQKIGW